MRDDQELLERAQSNDPDALGALYDSYAPRVYAYIHRRVSNAQVAEDLTGEVFVRVLRAIRSKRSWHTSFQAWLYRIAHNMVVDHYRRQPPLPPTSLDEVWLPAREGDPAKTVQKHLNRERLRWAIRYLTPMQQQVLALRFGEGLTARETAQILEKTIGSVEALQHRALAALRRILGETEQSEEREQQMLPSVPYRRKSRAMGSGH